MVQTGYGMCPKSAERVEWQKSGLQDDVSNSGMAVPVDPKDEVQTPHVEGLQLFSSADKCPSLGSMYEHQ